jgi:hypothetical protein
MLQAISIGATSNRVRSDGRDILTTIDFISAAAHHRTAQHGRGIAVAAVKRAAAPALISSRFSLTQTAC